MIFVEILKFLIQPHTLSPRLKCNKNYWSISSINYRKCNNSQSTYTKNIRLCNSSTKLRNDPSISLITMIYDWIIFDKITSIALNLQEMSKWNLQTYFLKYLRSIFHIRSIFHSISTIKYSASLLSYSMLNLVSYISTTNHSKLNKYNFFYFKQTNSCRYNNGFLLNILAVLVLVVILTSTKVWVVILSMLVLILMTL